MDVNIGKEKVSSNSCIFFQKKTHVFSLYVV